MNGVRLRADAPGGNPAVGTAPQARRKKTIWAGLLIAAPTLAAQVILRRELAPGEFGTCNALLGVILVVLGPAAGLGIVLRRTLPREIFPVIPGPLLLVWGGAVIVVLFAVLPLLDLPRSSLFYFTILGAVAGLPAIAGRPLTPARWCAVLGIGAAALRLIVTLWAGHAWPVAESGLGAVSVACLVAGLPALGGHAAGSSLVEAWRVLRPTLSAALATIGLAFAFVLFTQADRIAAQPRFGVPEAANPAFFNAGQFDDYQAGGLLFRGLLAGLLPVLGFFYSQRAAQMRTTPGSLRWLGIYLGVLVGGILLLLLAAPLVDAIFTGHPSRYLPGFGGAFFLLGLVQAVGVFALASRRWVECGVLVVGAVAYTAFVFVGGREPALMAACMAGGALMVLMLVLFTGVVRYARSHP